MERSAFLLPGGVNSPVRAYGAVGGSPPVIKCARGAYLTDEDDNALLDYVCSWGPAILGHAHPEVVGAVQEAAASGLSFGAPTQKEVDFAEAICARVPSIEMMRCVSSGTEATMSALRLARGYTGRDVIVKFNGAYHGHADALLVKAGSGAATFGSPDSGGVPADMVKNTMVAEYNDLEALRELFQREGSRIAAVIVEPVSGNMGCVPPVPGFLAGLISLCRDAGALSIFDEVMTGLRVASGGAQDLYDLQPDLTALGKIVGGGMPLAVYGGRREIMQKVSPLGPVYQAGTLSGNPLSVSAGLANLRLLTADCYDQLELLSARLEDGIRAVIDTGKWPCTVQRVGSMLTVFFHVGPIRNWQDASQCDTTAFGKFHGALLEQSIYWPAAQFEAAFLSVKHTTDDVDKTIVAIANAMKAASS